MELLFPPAIHHPWLLYFALITESETRTPMPRLKRIVRNLFLLGILAAVLGAVALGVLYQLISPKLPTADQMRNVQFQIPLRVYSADGKLISVFGEKRRIPVKLEAIPRNLQLAFIAGEDDRFYQHPGVDYEGILRAVWYLIRTGHKGPGGSTITMQLARNFFLSFEQTYSRKLTEIFLALKMEHYFSKDEILELYLNKIYLGHRAYGVAAAAQVYYGKKLSELTLPEMAMIAALPKAPSRINPISNPRRALQRRNYVLGRMHELGFIDENQWKTAVQTPDRAYSHGPVVEFEAPYVAEIARTQVVNILGKKAYTEGYNVHTTMNSHLQRTAIRALRKGLEAYDRRHGWRGAEAHVQLGENETPAQWNEHLKPFRPVAGLVPGLVVEMDENLALIYLRDGQTIPVTLEQAAWARPYKDRNHRGPRPKNLYDIFQPGDIIRLKRGEDGNWLLAQIPEVQGALVSLNPENGAIQALVGGYDFHLSKFNRVTQAERQPGSSFKPIIYSAALEKGYTAASLINDAPVVFDDPALEKAWRPENYSQKFFGPTRLREAMTHSRNLVSIRLLRAIGPAYAASYARRFGFEPDKLPHDLSLALGSASVPPLSMARAYATLANGGYLIDPYLVDRIENADGETLYRSPRVIACRGDCSGQTDPRAEQTLDPANAYIITSIMQDVIRRGTGKKARQLGRADLAGKTGTTNDQRDAWFSGFNPKVVTTTWVGFDQLSPLGRGEVGGRAALPIWIDYMREALKTIPETPFQRPDELISIRINRKTGQPTSADDPDSMIEIFRPQYAPKVDDPKQENPNTDQKDYDIF